MFWGDEEYKELKEKLKKKGEWIEAKRVCIECGKIYEWETYRSECFCRGELIVVWETESFWRENAEKSRVRKKPFRVPKFYLEKLRENFLKNKNKN